MAPKFGTSGLRGLVAELSPQLVADYTRAFLRACDTGDKLYIGRDLRESSPHIAESVAQAARDCGIATVDCGALPTPALALAAQEAKAAAIMVTGSHIPADRNGLKFYTRDGEITKPDEAAITSGLGKSDQGLTAAAHHDTEAARRYAARYRGAFGENALQGAKLGVCSHSSVGRDLLIQLLRDLGAEVVEFGRAAAFIPVDTEAVDAETRAALRAWAETHPLDAILSTDGDADRPLLTNARGQIIAGDILGQITARFLGADVVVTPVSSNSGAELSGAFGEVLRCKIGSPYVVAGINSRAGQRVVGYEANGGFLLGFDAQGPEGPLSALKTRDCLLPLLAVLAASKTAGGFDIAARVAAEPARFTATDRLTEIPTEASRALLDDLIGNEETRRALLCGLGVAPDHRLDLTDGLRMLGEGATLHLRPSGNAPEFRLYVESGDADTAASLLSRAMQRLSAMLAASTGTPPSET